MAVNHDNLGERITKLNETKDVEKRQNMASNVSNEVKIVVDSRKLSRGLRTTFEGVAMIFDSLDTDPEAIIAPIKAVETLKAAEATSTETAETENASENSTASASQDTVKSDTSSSTEESETTEQANEGSAFSASPTSLDKLIDQMFTNGVTMSKLVEQIGVAHQLIATSQQHLTKAQEETDRIISLLELEKGSKAELEKALRNALNK